MIPKYIDYQNPAKYDFQHHNVNFNIHDITCHQTLYKILTACIAALTQQHITNNNIYD